MPPITSGPPILRRSSASPRFDRKRRSVWRGAGSHNRRMTQTLDITSRSTGMTRPGAPATPGATNSANRDPRWAAVVARDPARTARSSTRCGRPASIAGRRARRAGRIRRTCAFIGPRADAEPAGFRPCRRCKPDQPPLEQLHAAKVAAICRRDRGGRARRRAWRRWPGAPGSARTTSIASSRR